MNFIIVLASIALLIGLFVLLGIWQRNLSEDEKERVLADIREAEAHGTQKPLAQHPQIDVQSCMGCGSCIAACPEDGVLGLVDGVAHVIHGARCIGHGRCAAACPVAAIQVGLGELARSPNLPILSPDFETTLPGLYVAGELGGFALIRIAVEQGIRAVDAIASGLKIASASPPGTNGSVDLLIVGAGPAGIGAALQATKRGVSYLVIDQDDIGGTVRKYPRRKLTLTGPLEMPLHGRVKREEFLKEELIEFWEGLIRDHRLQIHTGVKLEALEGRAGAFVSRTSTGPIRSRRVLLALGRRGTPRKLGAPGEEMEKVLYQLLDAASYTHSRILVVGGGDSAVEAATALASQPGNSVTISYRRESFFRLKSRNDERLRHFQNEGRLHVVLASNVELIDPDSVTLSVVAGNSRKSEVIANEYVFIFAGGEPPYPLLRGMGVRFNGDGLRTPAREEKVLEGAVV